MLVFSAKILVFGIGVQGFSDDLECMILDYLDLIKIKRQARKVVL